MENIIHLESVIVYQKVFSVALWANGLYMNGWLQTWKLCALHFHQQP
jgi:hypothetical protein